jgi:uncharacterized membrane protein YqhA
MLRQVLSASRYMVLIPIFGTLVASFALLIYEAVVVVSAIFDAVRQGSASPKDAKTLAVGLIEAVDLFLIGIALYIISLGLYTLFIDDELTLPKWLKVRDFDDLKSNLVNVVIVVLAVLFLRESITRDNGYDLLAFGAALALVIAALTLFLTKKSAPKD